MQLLNILPTANAVTTAAISSFQTYTYNNGQAGIGATITGTSTGPIPSVIFDGWSPVLGGIVLVRDEGTQQYNGLYIITQVGTLGSSPFILTRHPSMCTPADFVGTLIPVDAQGTAYKNTTWISIGTPGMTIGTSAVSFIQISTPGGSNYNTIEVFGTIMAAEPILNFPDGYLVGTDNPGNTSTDITIGTALKLGAVGGALFISGN
jgi:hypothetical protein